MILRPYPRHVGFEACKDVLLGHKSGELQADMVEADGHARGGASTVSHGRAEPCSGAADGSWNMAPRRPGQALPDRSDGPIMTRTYARQELAVPPFTEEQIRETLRRGGQAQSRR